MQVNIAAWMMLTSALVLLYKLVTGRLRDKKLVVPVIVALVSATVTLLVSTNT